MPVDFGIPCLVFSRSRFDAYIKARRLADQKMHQAMAALAWRPWVEEALTARDARPTNSCVRCHAWCACPAWRTTGCA